MTVWHVGRTWSGTSVEDACPCPKEPCGLVDPARADPGCPEHPVGRGRSIGQSHRAEDCPTDLMAALKDSIRSARADREARTAKPTA